MLNGAYRNIRDLPNPFQCTPDVLTMLLGLGSVRNLQEVDREHN